MEKISESVVKKDHAPKMFGRSVYVRDYSNDGVLTGKFLRSTLVRSKVLCMEVPPLPDGYFYVDKTDVPRGFTAGNHLRQRGLQLGSSARPRTRAENKYHALRCIPGVWSAPALLCRGDDDESYRAGPGDHVSQNRCPRAEFSVEKVYYNRPDTARVPDSGPTVASRSLMVVDELLRRHQAAHPVEGGRGPDCGGALPRARFYDSVLSGQISKRRLPHLRMGRGRH